MNARECIRKRTEQRASKRLRFAEASITHLRVLCISSLSQRQMASQGRSMCGFICAPAHSSGARCPSRTFGQLTSDYARSGDSAIMGSEARALYDLATRPRTARPASSRRLHSEGAPCALSRDPRQGSTARDGQELAGEGSA